MPVTLARGCGDRLRFTNGRLRECARVSPEREFRRVSPHPDGQVPDVVRCVRREADPAIGLAPKAFGVSADGLVLLEWVGVASHLLRDVVPSRPWTVART